MLVLSACLAAAFPVSALATAPAVLTPVDGSFFNHTGVPVSVTWSPGDGGGTDTVLRDAEVGVGCPGVPDGSAVPVDPGDSGTSFSDTFTPTDGTLYCYFVQDDINSEISAPSGILYDDSGPSTPGTPTGSAFANIASPDPSFSWSAATDGGSGVDHYDVFRRLGTALNGAPIAGTSYTDTSSPGEGPHTYTVVAYDKVGNASSASAYSVTIDLQRPTPRR